MLKVKLPFINLIAFFYGCFHQDGSKWIKVYFLQQGTSSVDIFSLFKKSVCYVKNGLDPRVVICATNKVTSCDEKCCVT